MCINDILKNKIIKKITVVVSVIMILFITLFVGKQDSYAAGYSISDKTVKGTLTIEYSVAGSCGESSVSSDLSIDEIKYSTSESYSIGVDVIVSRDINGKAKYSMTYNDTSNWETKVWAEAPGYIGEGNTGSNVICVGTGTFNLGTVTGEDDLSGKKYYDTFDKEIDLTYKGGSITQTDIWDENPDWRIDWWDLDTHNVDKITLSFTYPGYKKLNIGWDDGVSSVDGFTNGENAYYPTGDKAYTNFMIKNGYELDYIQEGDTKWYDSTQDSSNLSKWSNSWTMNRDRSIYIHTKKKSVTWTVKHYFQGIDGSYSNFDSEEKRETYTGNVGDTVTGVSWLNKDKNPLSSKYWQPALNKVGGSKTPTQSITLSEDASKNVISFYYPRAEYAVNVEYDSGILNAKSKSWVCLDARSRDKYRWQESVALSATVLSGNGYDAVWDGWVSDDVKLTDSNKTLAIISSMPAKDITVKATTKVGYTIRYLLENADGTWTTKDTVTGEAKTDSKITGTIKKSTTGIDYNSSYYVIPDEQTITLSPKSSENVIEYRYYNFNGGTANLEWVYMLDSNGKFYYDNIPLLPAKKL